MNLSATISNEGLGGPNHKKPRKKRNLMPINLARGREVFQVKMSGRIYIMRSIAIMIAALA
jgi:hypothetical protein